MRPHKVSIDELNSQRELTNVLIRQLVDFIGETFIGEFQTNYVEHRGFATFTDPKRPGFRITVNRHNFYIKVDNNLFETKTLGIKDAEARSLIAGEIVNARKTFDAAMAETVNVVRTVEKELNESHGDSRPIVKFDFSDGLPALFFCHDLSLTFRPFISENGGEGYHYFTVLTAIPEWAQEDDESEVGFILNRDSQRLGALLKMLRNASKRAVRVHFNRQSNSLAFMLDDFVGALEPLLEIGYAHISRYTANMITTCDDAALATLMPAENKKYEMVRVKMRADITEEQIKQHFTVID